MKRFYEEEVLIEFKKAHTNLIQEKINSLKLDDRIQAYQEKFKVAGLILQKFELLTREYQNQNKNLKERHEAIIDSEK